MLKRLDQILANTGYSSRKEAAALIKTGRITVNGVTVKDKAAKADPKDVQIDNEPIDHPYELSIMMNKPAGYVCSHDSAEGPRIYDLLPELWNFRNPQISTVGRLDKDTTGLIIITDRTVMIHRLTSPKHHVEKVYKVTVDKSLTPDLIALFASGTIQLEGERAPCLPSKLELLEDKVCNLTLTEGKYHQVKRMFETVAYTVTALERIRFGTLTLGDLAQGDCIDIDINSVIPESVD